MSLFPYNYNKHSGYGHQGSPIDWRRASDLAEAIFMWHSDHDTDCWTQSSDGAELDRGRISLGLIAMTADPGFVRMLIAVGEHVEGSLGTIRALAKDNRGDGEIAKMLKEHGLEWTLK